MEGGVSTLPARGSKKLELGAAGRHIVPLHKGLGLDEKPGVLLGPILAVPEGLKVVHGGVAVAQAAQRLKVQGLVPINGGRQVLPELAEDGDRVGGRPLLKTVPKTPVAPGSERKLALGKILEILLAHRGPGLDVIVIILWPESAGRPRFVQRTGELRVIWRRVGESQDVLLAQTALGELVNPLAVPPHVLGEKRPLEVVPDVLRVGHRVDPPDP
eukprot:UN3195